MSKLLLTIVENVMADNKKIQNIKFDRFIVKFIKITLKINKNNIVIKYKSGNIWENEPRLYPKSLS